MSIVLDVSSFENDSNGTKISRIEAKVEEVDKKSDNNANLNRLISDDREADEELIDNFRYC